MSELTQIQLGKSKHVNSINSDSFIYTDLQASSVELLPYDETSVIDVAQLFDDERQIGEVYRVYGTINFMSIINGLKINYDSVNDFFTRPRLGAEASGMTRNILNCFDIYLCRPLGNTFTTGGTVSISGNTKITSTDYQLKYQVLNSSQNFEIYKSGYGKNIFNDQLFTFDFTTDIDVRGQTDSFNKPLSELYLFVNFNPKTNKHGVLETVAVNTYAGGRTNRPYVAYSGGSIVNGDWVFYLPTDFEEIPLIKQEHYVTFSCTGGTGNELTFKYNPFIKIKLRDYGDEIISGNISGTSEIDHQIPNYAVKIDDNGNYIWKDFLPNGYIDPISNKGVNFPFINKRHYIFNNLVLPMTTDLNDSTTASTFADIKFGPAALQYTKPTSDLNNLGNKC